MSRKSATKTNRADDRDVEDRGQRSNDKRDKRETFENDMFADAAESPLYIPPERWPDGMALRWVRLEAGNAPDGKNWTKMTHRGWRPVKRERYDDLFPKIDMPGAGDNSDGFVIYGGLCLCERPMAQVLKDKARQERETMLQGESIKQYMEGGQNPNFPRQIMQDTTTRGKQMAFKE